jgi:hypothetical protein
MSGVVIMMLKKSDNTRPFVMLKKNMHVMMMAMVFVKYIPILQKVFGLD